MKDGGDGSRVVRRRDFLAGCAAAGGLLAAPVWAGGGDPAIEFARESCGSAGPRVLVGYASMCGSTGEIAAAIGKKLCAGNVRVEVRPLPEVEGIAGYDAFVIGSPIHAGMWLPEAGKFLLDNQGALAKAPVAYFIACMAMSSDKEASRARAWNYVERPLKLVPRIKPVLLGAFAGKVDYAKMPERYHPVMRKIVPDDLDARDWKSIDQWAEELSVKLIGG